MVEMRPERVFRCAHRDETLNIPRENCALLIEDEISTEDEGYGAYLLLGRDEQHAIGEITFHVEIPYERGLLLFLEHEEDGDRIIPLAASDFSERTLFVTGRCNSNCIMCPYGSRWRANAADVPVELLLREIDLMSPYADYLCITGGEPALMKESFFRILWAAKEHFEDCMVHILTNGRAFYYRDFFDEYRQCRPGKTLLGIPLHAAEAALHDEISGTPGSFQQTVAGLDRLHAAGEHIELRVVTSALNAHELPALAKFIAERYPDVYRVCLMGLEMMGNAMINRARVWISFDDLREQVECAAEILLQAGVPVQLYNFPLCMVSDRYRTLCQKSISRHKVRFFPSCENCAHQALCGGFFLTTMHMPGIEVKPF
jgi:His-Xaa-Ser system radical SAM maturase HxsC